MNYYKQTPFDKPLYAGYVRIICKMCDEEYTEERDEFQSDICSNCSEELTNEEEE